MTAVLILKTAALGDVLRTTSILPGLAERFPKLELSWVTAQGARELVEGHRFVHTVYELELNAPHTWAAVEQKLLQRRWDWVLSLDDEPALCALAAQIPTAKLSGAYLDSNGERRYTPDVAPWFDMGLISTHGKARADQLKVQNRRSHPEIFAAMFGVRMGRPELALDAAAEAAAQALHRQARLAECTPLIGLNTGAGGRWPSKELALERTVELVRRLAQQLGPRAAFLVLGGAAEKPRNQALIAAMQRLPGAPYTVDCGTDNSLLEFAAIISMCDLVLTSDSLALHIALARNVRTVAFFAPTSAAEIELYGLGEKVVSQAPDYCSYRPDADNRSITPERLVEATVRVLARPQACLSQS